MDLREALEVESPRYLLSLILHLPQTGAMYASRMGGQQFRGWDPSRYALAALVNAQRANNHILLMVNRDPKKPKPKMPELFPTPEKEAKKKEAYKPGSFAAIAASMMAKQRRKRELNG